MRERQSRLKRKVQISRANKYSRQWSRCIHSRTESKQPSLRSTHTAIRPSTPIRYATCTNERSPNHKNHSAGDERWEDPLERSRWDEREEYFEKRADKGGS